MGTVPPAGLPAHGRKADKDTGAGLPVDLALKKGSSPIPTLELGTSFLRGSRSSGSSPCILSSMMYSQEALPPPWRKKKGLDLHTELPARITWSPPRTMQQQHTGSASGCHGLYGKGLLSKGIFYRSARSRCETEGQIDSGFLYHMAKK